MGHLDVAVVPKAGGEPIPMKGRATVVVKKIGGKWLHVVDHLGSAATAPPSK